jgi:hypothetical protein
LTELNELDREYITFCTKDIKREEDVQFEMNRCLEILTNHGNIQEKRIEGRITVYIFKDGCRTAVAPRRYKFSGPLIPEGMDIKQFEVKE